MILKSRVFERIEPSRDAKSIYIFCEGKKREKEYFQYFKQIDSRINIEIYPLKGDENNSPNGLFEIAQRCFLKSEDNPNPKYELIKDLDEIWIVVDTDEWGIQLDNLRKSCSELDYWNIAQSNPCFEVWLYYHKLKNKPKISNESNCKEWKKLINTIFSGGFDSRRHPYLIKQAIDNSKTIFTSKKMIPDLGCTEVFNLAESIYPLVKDKLAEVSALIQQ